MPGREEPSQTPEPWRRSPSRVEGRQQGGSVPNQDPTGQGRPVPRKDSSERAWQGQSWSGKWQTGWSWNDNVVDNSWANWVPVASTAAAAAASTASGSGDKWVDYRRQSVPVTVRHGGSDPTREVQERPKESSSERRTFHSAREIGADEVDRYGRPKLEAPWLREDHVPGSSKGEGGYAMPGGEYLEPREIITLATRFKVSDFGLDWYKAFQAQVQDEFRITVTARPRRTHYQWIIKGYTGVPEDDMVAVLLELCTHAAWYRFDWMTSIPTHSSRHAWSKFADWLAPEISSWEETWEEKERRKAAKAHRSASRARSRRKRRRKRKEEKTQRRLRSRSPLRLRSVAKTWVPKEPAGGSAPAPSNPEEKPPDAPAPDNSEAKSPEERRPPREQTQSPSRSPSPAPERRKLVYILTGGWRNTGFVFPHSDMAKYSEMSGPPFDWDELEKDFLNVVQIAFPMDGVTKHDFLLVNCLDLWNPDSVNKLNAAAHTGFYVDGFKSYNSDVNRHLQQIIVDIFTQIVKFLVIGDVVEAGSPCASRDRRFIAFLCRSGKHRSLMLANLLRLVLLECEGWCDVEFDNWTHLTAKFWKRVKCHRRGAAWKCPKCHIDAWREDAEAWQFVQHWVDVFKGIWREQHNGLR